VQDKYNILARYFFDLADKVDEIADSDIAKSVESFGDEDYGSLVASNLDAAYWILSGSLELEGDSGVAFYVASSVYNDLLYRGYAPEWAWEESGLGDIFEEPLKDAPEEKIASTEPRPGEYVVWHTPKGVRAGMVCGPGKVYAFDGAVEDLSTNLQKISRQRAQALAKHNSNRIVASWRARNRVDG